MSKDDQIEMHFYINRLDCVLTPPSKRTFVRGALVFVVVSRYGSQITGDLWTKGSKRTSHH